MESVHGYRTLREKQLWQQQFLEIWQWPIGGVGALVVVMHGSRRGRIHNYTVSG